jgi:hypothetical protein
MTMTPLPIFARENCCRFCRRSFQLALLGIWLAISPGCQTMQIPDTLPWAKDKKPAALNHILAVWTEAVHSQTGQPAQRGFGGRLIFFDAAEQPMEVKGKLTIFVFDDQNSDVQNPAAKYKFVFPSEVLPKHFSKSELGPSYSFWVPLAAGNAPTHHFSLVAKFESDQGETVLSSLTKKVMVGSGSPKDKLESNQTSSGSGVQPASYRELESDKSSESATGFSETFLGRALASDSGREIRSETIELTPSFSK